MIAKTLALVMAWVIDDLRRFSSPDNRRDLNLLEFRSHIGPQKIRFYCVVNKVWVEKHQSYPKILLNGWVVKMDVFFEDFFQGKTKAFCLALKNKNLDF